MSDAKDRALAEIVDAVKERSVLETRIRRWVIRAREKGATWLEVADALGVTKQTAWKVHGGGRRSA